MANNSNKKIADLSFPFFFILPWLGFILSLFNIKSRISSIIYIASAIVFGYAFSFADPSADSIRYGLAFQSFDTSLNYERIISLYKDGELRDLYRVLLYYFTSLFSNNPKVMFAIAGGVYGFFSYKNMLILKENIGYKFDNITFIISLCFFVYCCFANINGLRFTTGAMVMFFVVYNLIINNKKKYLLGVFVLPLFHYSFILLIPILLIYLLIKNILYKKNRISPILYYFFIATFLASWLLGTNSIKLGFLSDSGLIGGEIGNRFEYLNSDSLTEHVTRRAQNSLFLSVQKYFDYAIRIYVFIVVLYLFKLFKRIRGNKSYYYNYLAFILFYYSFSFISLSFPSGERFMLIGHLFLFALLAKVYSMYDNRFFQKLILLSLPAFIFNITFNVFFLSLMLVTHTYWYGNFFWIIYEGLGFKISI